MKFVSDSRRLVPVFGTGLLLMLPLGVAAATGGDHGSLDPSFGKGGIVTTAVGSGANALVLQSDGKLVAAGAGPGDVGFTLVRYMPNGSLDPSFGRNGVVRTRVGSTFDGVLALVLQPDGKLVAAGAGGPAVGVDHFALVRYTPNGSLDRSFGVGGIVVTKRTEFGASTLVLQPDRKLVVAGEGRRGFTLVRYSRNGSLDPSFGTSGIVTTGIVWLRFVNALVLQPDGKLVAAGLMERNDHGMFALARYNIDGSLDRSFGRGGAVFTSVSPVGSEAFALSVAKGELVAAGSSASSASNSPYSVITLVRYQANGTLDGNFGHRGMVTTPIGSGNARALALVAQPDGKLVAAGYSAKGPSLFGSFALVRYNPNGTLDPSFGKGAIVRTAIGSGDARAAALVLQPDGKLVAAGTNGRGFALARYGK